MKTIIACALLWVIVIPAFGQGLKYQLSPKALDSLKFTYYRMAALKYPSIRQASISTDFVSNANVNTKLLGDDLFDGKAQIVRVKAHLTVPVVSWGKNSISSTFGITNQHLNLSSVNSYTPRLGVKNMKTNLTTLNFVASFTRTDSLFHKPLTLSVAASGLANAELDRTRLVFTGFASINLFRNPVSSLSVGLALISDRSSVTPVTPIISYSRKFSNMGMELLADMPSRIVLRKELSAKSFVSLGSELTGNFFFFNLNESNLPANAIGTTLIIKSGVTLEHLISKSVVVGVSAGIFTTPSTKLMGDTARPADYFIKTKTTNEPYLNLTVSFLPFWKGLKLQP
ncbi:hypothetical protein [Dyadobacter diqingensis]|uniref:hypothetical protein n=1 Tax=Dyadobacter diqingensis TaxID=2938121 RepID=UPI0020C4817D|nr:hypothetical protein [Dyadobacter diqingensis]